MKILYVTTIGITMTFFKDFIKKLLDDGHTVDIATNETDSQVPSCYREWGCDIYPISTNRSPLSSANISAIKQIKKLVEQEKYDIVHCHTPIAAMCTRLACRKARKSGTRVFYTAHGFHFYKGAPLKNWMLYYPVEKFCAHFTDVLITINTEDYALAQKKLKAKKVEYVPGVGMDINKFADLQISKESVRKELDVPDNATLLLSVGELNDNKNHETVIKAIADLDVYYLIAGIGDKKDYLENLIDQLGLGERVRLLGYRKDIPNLLKATDVYVLPSKREGLNVSVMEAMASGLPCAVGKIRGNVDLIDENGGVLFDPRSVENCKHAIEDVLRRDKERLSKHNLEKMQTMSIKVINARMKELYYIN